MLYRVCLERISSLGNLRTTVKKLSVHCTNMNSISQVLQCDVLHRCNLDSSQVRRIDSKMNNDFNIILF